MLIWSDKYKIQSFDVDAGGRLSLSQLCRFFQETAYHHAVSYRLGYQDLVKNGMLWVLYRYRVVMESYPQWDDTIIIETFPTYRDKIDWGREFRISDISGNIIGKAISAWIIVDSERRRPIRTEKVPHLDIEYLPSQFDKVPDKIPDLTTPSAVLQIKPQYFDLDINDHVNNNRYIDWILEAYTPEYRKNHIVRDFAIDLLGEAVYGDNLTLFAQEIDKDTRIFSLKRDGDGKELCRSLVGG